MKKETCCECGKEVSSGLLNDNQVICWECVESWE